MKERRLDECLFFFGCEGVPDAVAPVPTLSAEESWVWVEEEMREGGWCELSMREYRVVHV